jgi:nucleotide-binding universal stress UspA family protein
MFKKILVPLDGSPMAELAVQPALTLAKAGDGELILLRSTKPVFTSLPEYAGEYEWAWPVESYDESHEAAQQYLHDLNAGIQSAEVAVRSQVVDGDEAGAIIGIAEAEEVDLIVMTSHGRSGARRKLLGSVTERVLHHASCPVLVIRSEMPVKRIVITLDGSPLSEKALGPGLFLAQSFGADATLLRVNPIISILGFDYGAQVAGEAEEYVRRGAHEHAETYLAYAARRMVHAGIGADTAVIDGPVVDSILDYIEGSRVDLLIMTTHGRSGLKRWVYGSVTSKVLSGSKCSMLIIRPPQEELQ